MIVKWEMPEGFHEDVVIGGIRTLSDTDVLPDGLVTDVIDRFTSYGFYDVTAVYEENMPPYYRYLITVSGHPDAGVAGLLKRMVHGERIFVISVLDGKVTYDVAPFSTGAADWNRVERLYRIHRDFYFRLVRTSYGKSMKFDNIPACPNCQSGEMQKHGFAIVSGGEKVRRYRCLFCGWVGFGPVEK
jgi:hypothetical protein